MLLRLLILIYRRHIPFAVPGTTLHVSFDDSASLPTDGAGRSYVITRELTEVPESEITDWYSYLSTLDLATEGQLSYRHLWPHLVHPNRGALLTYVLTYEDLSTRLSSDDVSEIVTHGLEAGYRRTVEDAAREFDIEVHHEDPETDSRSGTRPLLSALLLLLDQLLVLVLRALPWSRQSDSERREREVLVFPFPGRYDSLVPVIRRLEGPVTTVVTPLALSWRWLSAGADWPDDLPAHPLTEFSDLSSIVGQVGWFARLRWRTWQGDVPLAARLRAELEREREVSLPGTVDHVVARTIERDTRQLLSFPLIDTAVEESDATSAVVGGMAPRDRYLLTAAEAHGLETYYVPHSIAYGTEVLPPTSRTTHFVSGSADRRLLESVYPGSALSNVVPIGRPYIDTLHEGDRGGGSGPDGTSVVLGTQPYADWIRRSFVTDVLDELNRLDQECDVVVKIHPSESRRFYLDLLESRYDERDIEVAGGPIEEFVGQGSVLITINSNVGMESILLGAYCVSYNPFRPFAFPSSSIDGERVPEFTAPAALRAHLTDGLDDPAARNRRQVDYLREEFRIGGSAARIAEYIEREG
jgi:hypothetical protein